jgi:hypothetical protein
VASVIRPAKITGDKPIFHSTIASKANPHKGFKVIGDEKICRGKSYKDREVGSAKERERNRAKQLNITSTLTTVSLRDAV